MKFHLNKFLIFGDSITEFCFNTRPYLLNPVLADTETGHQFALGAALTSDYARKLDIVHRGYSGYNSRLARSILPLILKAEHDTVPDSRKIKIAFVFFGTNDASVGGPQAVGLEEYRENMTEIVDQLLARDIKVILVTPAYHNAVVWEGFDKYTPDSGHRTNERNLEYVKVAKSIAAETKVAVLDLYDEFTKHAAELGVDPKTLLIDGIHYAGTGYEAFYNGLMRVIAENYPEYSPSAMKINLDEWRNAIKDGFLEELQQLE